MDITTDITILIPARIDCSERKQNLDAVLSFFLQQTHASLIVLEADSESKIILPQTERLTHVYIKDADPIFHRTRYLNKLMQMAFTDIVGIWDTDVLIPTEQIIASANHITEGNVMSFPYNGKFIFLNSTKSDVARRDFNSFHTNYISGSDPVIKHSVGGAFLVNRSKYLEAGGENEAFYGWGSEDIERVKRMEILELPVNRVEGCLYHLHHPRGINSTSQGDEREIKNLKALLNTCRMNKQQMKDYIENKMK